MVHVIPTVDGINPALPIVWNIPWFPQFGVLKTMQDLSHQPYSKGSVFSYLYDVDGAGVDYDHVQPAEAPVLLRIAISFNFGSLASTKQMQRIADSEIKKLQGCGEGP